MKNQTVVMLLLAALCAPAWAINKCTGADGKVSFQDAPCHNTTKAETVNARSGNTVVVNDTAAAQPRVEPNMKLKGPKEAGQLLGYYRQWRDNEKLLESAPRIALSGPVAAMQKLQRDIEEHQAPGCLIDAKRELVALVSTNTEATIQFMQKQEVSNMAYQWVQRPKLLKAFESAIQDARCE